MKKINFQEEWKKRIGTMAATPYFNGHAKGMAICLKTDLRKIFDNRMTFFEDGTVTYSNNGDRLGINSDYRLVEFHASSTVGLRVSHPDIGDIPNAWVFPNNTGSMFLLDKDTNEIYRAGYSMTWNPGEDKPRDPQPIQIHKPNPEKKKAYNAWKKQLLQDCAPLIAMHRDRLNQTHFPASTGLEIFRLYHSGGGFEEICHLDEPSKMSMLYSINSMVDKTFGYVFDTHILPHERKECVDIVEVDHLIATKHSW